MGVLTGFNELDRILDTGLQNGSVYLLAARPAMVATTSVAKDTVPSEFSFSLTSEGLFSLMLQTSFSRTIITENPAMRKHFSLIY